MSKSIAALFIVLLAGCGAIPSTDRSAASVEEAVQGWKAAYDSRDPAKITALYARDAVFWGTTSPTIRTTPETIAEYFKDAPKRAQARVKILDQHVRVAGDMALSAGAYTFSDVRDGKAIENPSRFTFVFRREGDRWMIVHHHSSRVPAP